MITFMGPISTSTGGFGAIPPLPVSLLTLAMGKIPTIAMFFITEGVGIYDEKKWYNGKKHMKTI